MTTCGLPSYASQVSKHADDADVFLRSDLGKHINSNICTLSVSEV